MNKMIRLIALSAGLLASQICVAQAPAGAPTGATGLCKDGTYSTASSKSGACRGHQGVQTWYAAPADKSSTGKASTKPAPAATPASAPTPSSASPAPPAKQQAHTSSPAPTPAPASPASTTKQSSHTTVQAPGGGAGKVWLNTDSNVYHCPGSQYYGKTKAGAYMSEADAKAKGAHPDHGKACGQ